MCTQTYRSYRSYLLALCLLGLSACSSTTFFYNRLDFILPWYLDRYVDLDRAQSRALDIELERLLEWHRQEELPQYLNFLDDLLLDFDTDLASSLSVAQLQAYVDRAELAWFRVRDPAVELLLELAQDLSQEQIDDFIEVMEKKQRKYEDKYLQRDDDEVRKDAFESFKESLEDYLGRLERPQLERLRAAAAALLRSDDTWLRERRAWITELGSALQREPGWQQDIKSIVEGWGEQLNPEVAALYDHNTGVVQAAIVEIVNIRSEKQDARLHKKLEQFRDDLTLLIRQGEDP